MVLKRRTEQPAEGAAGAGREGADEFAAAFPALWEFLVLEVWPGSAERRQAGTLLLFLQDGKVKARLVDHDRDEVAFFAYGSVWEALQGCDRALAEGSGDWRRQKAWKGSQGPRGGKS